ncbi:MAG: DNA repair protein RecO [Desulfobacterales bacterium]
MASFSTPAITLRRIQHGDFDVILNCFTLARGKMSVIAKYAKKSTRRFGGVLELFSLLQLQCSAGRGLPVLQEAELKQPFAGIRGNYRKTAYASYWAELINLWMEENVANPALFNLLAHVLTELDGGDAADAAVLNLLFQVRFMALAGFLPELTACCACGCELEQLQNRGLRIDPVRGGAVCGRCGGAGNTLGELAKGTLKLLQWLGCSDLTQARRVRFSAAAVAESTVFLETFVPYHLGKTPRSLKFLREVR